MALARKLTAKIYEIKAHNDGVTSLDLGETGRVLVTGGQDRNVNLWAIGQEECFMSLTGHNRPIDCVRFAYNDDFVYSADDIGIIRRWDLNAQQICSTLNGHMKSVRTLDFNPSGEYIVSGSNDTTVRLWDVRNQNRCIKVYRGHISHVNSVKFSPDGLWIASAGTEGTIIIWDIRKSKQIMDFAEQPPAAAITCIQFHPFEFLLAVGRVDGTVCIYDLETQMRIARTDASSQFYGQPIKCITFSENGECLFVGTVIGISVIGWEPDREYDHIKAAWTTLGDMKVVNGKLFCGSFDKEYVCINALSIDRVFPFYNPSNVQQPAFSYNSTTRKSFSRGNQKLRLSLTAGPKPARLLEEDAEDQKSPSLDGHSSPNLSLEMVDETGAVEYLHATPNSPPVHPLNGYGSGGGGKMGQPFSNFASNGGGGGGYASFGGSNLYNTNTALHFDGPSSLKVAGERDIYQFDRLVSGNVDLYGGGGDGGFVGHEMEFNLNDSNPPVICNYDHTEMVEDFPVNQGTPNAGPGGLSSGYGPSVTTVSTKTAKPKTTSHIQKRTSQIALSSSGAKSLSSTASFQSRHRLSQVSSVSSTELHKLDDNLLLKKSSSSHLVNKGNASRQRIDSQSHANGLNKENARNKNITVQIITKPPPPTRSRTSHELRSPQRQSNRLSTYTADTTTNIPVGYRPDPSLMTQSGVMQRNRTSSIDDSSEIHMLTISHEQVYQELSNRHATLQLIRNSTRSQDIVGALKQAIKISGRTVFVDLLGSILEKTSSWNLDLCLLLLPEIYELLQSQHKFHYTRACDTLRVILKNFLPIIQENIDPWSASGLGVDVSREERQRKCIECQRWLLQIRNIADTNHIGNTLTQLQNLIVNI